MSGVNYYIGIDLGTSSCKGILVDRSGKIYRESSASYPVLTPHDGWTEQDPGEWLAAARRIIAELSEGVAGDVRGLSVAGQMHGLVVLDENDNVIRPCILWNDGRCEKQTAYLNEVIGRERLSELTGNIAFAGFTAPKLLWMYEEEPELFAKINKIMLPKDYLAYRLTGVHSTDYSDASGMLLVDVEHKCWSDEMLDICRVKREWLPQLYESYEVTGKVKAEFGLPDCIVTAGAGDNAAAAIGTGTVRGGSCNVSLGTSGTIFISQDTFSVDPKNALHSFAHANGRWHLMGCILSAASARKWWLKDILGDSDYALDEKGASDATSDVVFLPYLSGERSPHNDVRARGAFVGLSSTTTRGEMSRAIMEGVAFALRDCLEVAKSNGVSPCRTTLCGGGAKSGTWRQIIADTLELPVDILETEQGPSMGGAVLAMVGAEEYGGVEDASGVMAKVAETVMPDPSNYPYYEKKYEIFRRLYPAIRSASQI
ncbi:MAG: xylulokinase [Clostridia bacterium]|nr:xylulokinase [Clostridia bacterium]